MGIAGLIPFLEKASTPVNIRQLQGSSVAVDSYCWLHKGVFGCAEKLIKGETTDIHIQYCLKYVDMLLRHKIKVTMVFDGRHLPAKAETERKRREARNESKQLAKEYLRRNEIEKARSHMRRAVDVTHEMALELIKACRKRNVDCIVAPYEADAQMAWLNKQGLAEYVVTEDSDLTLFGASKILFKLDLMGQALLVENTKLYLSMGCKPEKYTFDKFRRMCILSGCDYLDSLPGIGLKKACKFILTTDEEDMAKALKKIPSYLKMKQLEVTDEYIESFLKAEATFKHMFIYNPLERRMQRLHELDEFQTDECFCGNAGSLINNSEKALQLALGNLNPFTFQLLDNWHPNNILKTNSIWFYSKDSHIKNKTTEDKMLPKNQSGSIFHFKKIEYKNMAEMGIAESLSAEKNKLEESEIFSMYKTVSPKLERKRKRQQSSSSCSEGEVIVDKSETPKKHPHNPFAKSHSSAEDLRISPVCTNNSLLKLLSPKKLNTENINRQSTSTKKSIKSRFFADNIKQAVQKTFAVRDLTTEMLKLEKKASEYCEQQKDLYYCSSLEKNEENKQKILDDLSEKESVNSSETMTTSNTEDCVDSQKIESLQFSPFSEEIISLSDTDEEHYSSTFQAMQTFAKTTQKSKLIITKSNTSVKKRVKTTRTVDAKQSKLSMFGFQKRPSLKKL